jgi:hypothetical protein
MSEWQLMSVSFCRGLAFLALALVSSSALANDSIAELPAGGLVLTKTAQIAMASEDLFLSRDRVRVIYRFENLTKTNIVTEVAFPLPDISSGEMPIEIPNPANENFVTFVTKVDGAPVSLNVEQRAFLDGKEVTDVLRARKIPLSPRHPDVSAAILALAPADRRALARSGLVLREDYDAGAGWEVGYTANWTLKTRF